MRSSSTRSSTTRCGSRTTPAGRWSSVRRPPRRCAPRSRRRGGVRARHRPQPARARPDRADVWLTGSSRPTRSQPATSRRASGASRRSRSSSPSARSCRGPSRASAPSRRRRTRTRATAPTGWRSCARARAADTVKALTEADDGREHRQVGVVDANGGSATFTGEKCFDWAGGRTGPCFAAQGNILVGEETVAALATTFTATAEAARASGCSSASPRPRRPAATAAASNRRRCSSSSATAATPP